MNFFGTDLVVFDFLPFFPLTFSSDSDFILLDLDFLETLSSFTDYLSYYFFLFFAVLVFFLPDLF